MQVQVVLSVITEIVQISFVKKTVEKEILKVKGKIGFWKILIDSNRNKNAVSWKK